MGHYQALSVRYAITVNALEQGPSSLPISPNAYTLSALWQLARLVTFPTGCVSERETQTVESLVYVYNVYVRVQYNYANQNARWGPPAWKPEGADEIALSHLRTNAARPYHGRHICRKGTPSALLV